MGWNATTSDADAIHDNVSGEIAAVTEKASPVSGDLLLIEDSAASNAKKRVQIGNLPGSSDPDYVLISAGTVASNVIDFTGIAASYRDLRIVWQARSSRANDVDSLIIQVGNSTLDTGSNYKYGAWSLDDNSTTNVSTSTSATSIIIGRTTLVGASSDDTTTYGAGEIIIPDYLSSLHKSIHGTSGFASSDATAGAIWRTSQASGTWASTSAITEIRLSAANGNLTANSTAALYGLG